MAEDQIFSARATAQDAIAAFEAVAVYAWERLRPPDSRMPATGGRDPAQDHDRLSGMLCALRHLADKLRRSQLHRSVLEDGNRGIRRRRARGGHPRAPLPAGSRSRSAGYRRLPPQHQRPRRISAAAPGPRIPSPTCALRRMGGPAASRPPSASITSQLITDLRHYADRQHIDFGSGHDRRPTRRMPGSALPPKGPSRPGWTPASALPRS